MLLIIFLGLIAKLTSVSGDCEFENLTQNNFNWNNYTDGPWYALNHSSDVLQDDFTCVVFLYGSPEGNTMPKTIETKLSNMLPFYIYGTITDWTENGCYSLKLDTVLWSGRYCIIAVDYVRYAILKQCSFDYADTHVYVAYRTRNPDAATVQEVLMKLQENGIDSSQLVVWPAVNCN